MQIMTQGLLSSPPSLLTSVSPAHLPLQPVDPHSTASWYTQLLGHWWLTEEMGLLLPTVLFLTPLSGDLCGMGVWPSAMRILPKENGLKMLTFCSWFCILLGRRTHCNCPREAGTGLGRTSPCQHTSPQQCPPPIAADKRHPSSIPTRHLVQVQWQGLYPSLLWLWCQFFRFSKACALKRALVSLQFSKKGN